MAASLRIGLAAAFLASSFSMPVVSPAQAREGDRTLRLYFGHTGERGEFTFKRNGRYDRGELARINNFLRDWRRNEPANMDPALLDLIWTIYKKSGARGDINVVSAFRSLETNDMLRRRSKGVAKTSQHTAGKAMDFYIPDVPLAKLRAVALKEQNGGVGYYPKSGSPFVHVDTGSVRHWPRMTRQQLIALFPNGETIHVPSDGKPLPGYQRALAMHKSGASRTQLAFAETAPAPRTPRAAAPARTEAQSSSDRATVAGWLGNVFKNDGDAGDEAAPEIAMAANQAPAAESIQTAQEATIAAARGDSPRIPRARPSEFMMAFADPGGSIPSEDQVGLAELALAPLPRPRPTDFAIAAIPKDGNQAASPAPADPLNLLAARMSVEAPTPPGLQIAANEGLAQLPSADDAARLVALMASQDPAAETSAPEPQQPVVLAALPAHLPKAGEPIAFRPAATDPLDLALRRDVSTPIADRFAVPEDRALPDYSLDRESLRWMMSAETARTQDFAALEMPQPSGAPELYAAPEKGREVKQIDAADAPRTDRFARADTGGFFQKLFGVTR
jgi:uncharacterized protein YcbK (DUF882 family)